MHFNYLEQLQAKRIYIGLGFNVVIGVCVCKRIFSDICSRYRLNLVI
jgi:hypothetical protein